MYRELNIDKEKDRISSFIAQLHKRLLVLEGRDKQLTQKNENFKQEVLTA